MNTKIRPVIAGKMAIVTGASSGAAEGRTLEYAFAGDKAVLAPRVDSSAGETGRNLPRVSGFSKSF